MVSRKKFFAIISVLLILVLVALPCFALDGYPDLSDAPTVGYSGLDSIDVYRLSDNFTEQHQVSFFDNDFDNASAYGYTNVNNNTRCLFEYRPMRSISLSPYPWTETRMTFKGDVIYFHFSDIMIPFDGNEEFLQHELFPYASNPVGVAMVYYSFTITDYAPNDDGEMEFRTRYYTQERSFNQSSAQGNEIIYLMPSFDGINKYGKVAYLENLTVELQLVRPNNESMKFYYHGPTRELAVNDYQEYIAAIDYNPKEFDLISSLFYDIQLALEVELFPNFSLGALLAVIVAVPLLLIILKFFFGG